MKQISKDKLTLKEGHLIAANYYQSKLKPRDFCAQNNIPYHILKYWRAQYDKRDSANDNAAKLLPIKILPPQAETMHVMPLKIIVNDNFTIEVPANVDMYMLKLVLQVCKTCG